MKTWLPDMDLNHDKQIQSLLCYRYTIGQWPAAKNVKFFPGESSPAHDFLARPAGRLTTAGDVRPGHARGLDSRGQQLRTP